jgi:putative aldouronate transport system permease protein
LSFEPGALAQEIKTFFLFLVHTMKRSPVWFRKLKQARIMYLLLLPSILYFCVFSYFPIINGAILSFQDFRFVGKSKFVGLENYAEAISTPGFWKVLRNTLILGLGNVILTAFVPLLLALLLNEIFLTVWKRFLQTVLYLPHLFSWVVVGGIWIFVLSPNSGFIKLFVNLLGIKAFSIFTEETYARPLFIGINLWKQSGYVCILYLASIAGINPELYEAAMVDGAGAFKRGIYITLPELYNTLKVVLMLNIMGSLRIFDQVYVLRNEVIASKVDVLMYYVYVRGLQQFKIGYAAAISVLIFIATLILTLMFRRIIRYSIR